MSEWVQWPRARYWDRAWNPIVGCRKCSPACENCWAEAWARRFGQSFVPHETRQQRPPRKGVVFAGNMTDLFGEWVTQDFVSDAEFGEEATYLWLTKRPGRMFFFSDWFETNDTFNAERHYFGITAENHSLLDERLRRVWGIWPEFAKGWLSLEPLLGPVRMRGVKRDFPWLKWVVVGCESGPGRRPCKVEWVESVVEECMEAGVPVFVKQLELGGRVVTDIEKFPEELRVRQVPWAGRGKGGTETALNK